MNQSHPGLGQSAEGSFAALSTIRTTQPGEDRVAGQAVTPDRPVCPAE